MIGDTLTADAEVGIELIGVANTSIHDCIIDFNSSKGVRIADNGTNFGGNVRVAGCYIALTGTAGVAAIESANTVSNTQNTRNRFSDNELVVYSGSTGTYGISTPTANGQFIARGNTISNFATNDIFMASGGNIVEANACLSTGQALSNIYTNGTLINTVANNIGTVYTSFHRITQAKLGGMSVLSCDQAPASGTWPVGAYCRNSAPAAGSPKGWFCTVAGTPGTWVSEGNL